MSGRRSIRPEGRPAGSSGTSVTSSIVAPRATSGVNTARGDRPGQRGDGGLELPDRACVVRAMSRRPPIAPPPRCAGRVLADETALEAVALQFHGIGAQLEASLRGPTRLRVGRAQAEVRVGDVAGDGDADGLAE